MSLRDNPNIIADVSDIRRDLDELSLAVDSAGSVTTSKIADGAVTPPKISGVMETLWTNTNPAASFAGQAVTLSEADTNFDLILITARAYQDAPQATSTVASAGSDLALSVSFIYNNKGFSGARTVTRTNATTYTFGNAYEINSEGSSGSITQTNDWLIPQKIIGFKF